MKKIRIRYASVILVAASLVSTTAVFSQDRNPKYERRFPAAALIQNGGGVYDVTDPPERGGVPLRRANGNDDKLDTAAIRDAIDHVRSLMRGGRSAIDEDVVLNPRGRYVIYFPSGVYIVDDTLVYRGETKIPLRWQGNRKGPRSEVYGKIAFIGESRASTVIRLAPNAKGFNNPDKPKPVISFRKPEIIFNNWPAGNTVKHLTIHVGNNTGAIGIDYWSANSGRISDVRIRANVGKGHTGIRYPIAVAAGYFSDIKINGFDRGIDLAGGSRASAPTFEHVSLVGQRSVGMRVSDPTVVVRKLKTRSSAIGLELVSDEGQVIVLDSDFEGTDDVRLPAIRNRGDGHVFLSNVSRSGDYRVLLRDGESRVTRQATSEYTSKAFVSTRGTTASHDLGAIRSAPVVPYNNRFRDWVKPSNGSRRAIQSALESGSPVVYFPEQRQYTFDTAVVDPGTVWIDGMYKDLSGTIEVRENSPDPLVILNVKQGGETLRIRNLSRRTIVLEGCSWARVESDGTPATWFINNSGQLGTSGLSGATVWGRWLNMEGGRKLISNDNTWVQLGMKHERHEVGDGGAEASIEVRGSSDMVILGSTYGTGHSLPLMKIFDGTATLISNNNARYDRVGGVIIDNGNGRVGRNQFPKRSGKDDERFYIFKAID